MKTAEQYDDVMLRCRDIFSKKIKDYGPSWRIMRPQTVNDQLFIKIKRIRELETTGVNLVGDSIDGELVAIVNYSIIGLIQLQHPYSDQVDMSADEAVRCYDAFVQEAKRLMLSKNHDYGEAWRDMLQTSITDLIYTKILRNKSIIANDNQTLVSEGADGNYYDMINYAVFNLIKRGEQSKSI